MKIFNKKQYEILSDRYFECYLGDFSSFVWMVIQSLLIALLIILRWKSWQATESLYFILSLSSIWFGCINSCREIAKEKTIFLRERIFGINVTSYYLSKVKILMIIGVLEVSLFFFMINHFVDIATNTILTLTILIELYLAGVVIGLLLSSFAGAVSKAVVSVPLAILPQIVFSKFVLPEDSLKGLSLKIEKIMPVKWGFLALTNIKVQEIDFLNYLQSFFILLLFILFLLFITILYLWGVED